ncbi:MAG: glycine C-acetyltransferase [archaeon]
MRNPVSFLKHEYDHLVKNDLDWRLWTLEGPSTPECVVNGKNVIMLCSNNYLGLTNHPKVKEAAIEAVKSYGAGSGSVRAIAGTMDLHMKLERRLAEYKHAEASLVYSAGFTANIGLIPQLVDEGDLVISDELNHGSIIDGVRLCRADRAVYRHCDTEDLARVLDESEKKNFRRILVITDGVFSMDGDIAPLNEIVKLGEEHGAMIYVDDAHGDGVLGEKGRGVTSHFDVEGKVHVEMGTFSKAFGVAGGYISGSRDLVNYAYNKSRSWLLSGSAPPAVTAACIAALEVIESEPEHLERLWRNTRFFKKQLKNLGFDIGNSQTPITPIIVGESSAAKKMSSRLYEEGMFALPIVFPMVAKDRARIRTMMNAALTQESLDAALAAIERIGKELGVI